MEKELKNYFIPHEGNGYRPDSLQKFSLGIMAFLAILSFTLANIHALLWISSEWLVSTVLPAVIVELTNDERDDETLSALRRSPELDRAAQLKAEDMAKHSYFAHYSPSGVSPWYWFDQAGYKFVHAGENLAVHFTDSDEVVEGWMNSPGHRANILNSNYTEIGIGTAEGEYDGYPTVFVVQLFGTPAAPTPTVAAAETDASEQEDPVTIEVTTEAEPIISDDSEVSDPSLGEEVATSRIETVDPEPGTEPVPVSVAETTPAATAAEEKPLSEAAVSADGNASLFLDLATTSRDGVPLAIDPNTPLYDPTSGTVDPDSIAARAATQPHLWLQIIYGILMLVVGFSLAASIFLEWKRQHPVQIAYGAGLLAVMFLLYHVHTVVTSGVTII